jgi:hypothetical protein
MHQKSSGRKVTHSTIVVAFGGLTLEFPKDPSKGLGFKPPMFLWNILSYLRLLATM